MNHRLRLRAVENVEIERASLGAEGVAVPVFLVEVKAGPPRVVEKNTRSHTLAKRHEVGKSICKSGQSTPAIRKASRYSRSVNRLSAAIVRSGLVAVPEVVFLGRSLQVAGNRRSVVLDGPTRQVLSDPHGPRDRSLKAERIFADRGNVPNFAVLNPTALVLDSGVTLAVDVRESGRTAQDASSGN